ncbi:glutathionylspermidine synthase family protein [Microvirga brassicacearum]|uniref:Glutathionylspermidine synthase family protein n=1 Tax=Microvirga brassicacearum TaxID=2580413 RepID=A0A5N3P392_9HYPH|nr:glutathionylspermidine synthase family protein [Microvirga brassicacearum]
MDRFVRKPIFSREGANVTLVRDGQTVSVDGPYDDCPFVVQEATRLFASEHGHAVIGSWIVGDEPCGIGIREDASAITMDMSRFIPHVILG